MSKTLAIVFVACLALQGTLAFAVEDAETQKAVAAEKAAKEAVAANEAAKEQAVAAEKAAAEKAAAAADKPAAATPPVPPTPAKPGDPPKPADAKPADAKPADAKPADAKPSAPPPGPAVTTIYDERIAALATGIEEGKLVIATDPVRHIALDEIASVDLGNTPVLEADWIGQDNHDVAQVGGAAGGNGVQDIHIRLRGLPGGRTTKQILVLTRGGKGRGVWRLDTARTPNWKLVAERGEGSPVADVYLEPINHDCFERDFEITVTYDDGATVKTTLKGTTHTDHQLKVGAAAANTEQAPAGPPNVVVHGRDKTVLRGQLLELGDESLKLQTTWAPELTLALTEVRGITFTAGATGEAAQKVAARLAEPGAEDSVVALGREQAALQVVTGTAHGIVEGKLRFTFEGEERPINVSRLAGIVYAQHVRKHSGASPYQLVQLLSGDVVSGSWKAVDEKQLAVETTWGGQISIPRPAVAKILFRNGKVTYLSDLDPASVEEVPYFGHLVPYQRDQGFSGGPIKLKDKTYPKGLAVHSRSLITYAVDGQYESFKALVGFDESGHGRGRVRCRLLGDGRELFIEPDLRASGDPSAIEVSLAGVKQLALEIDFGEDEDIGDRVLWADARLFRSSK